MDKSPRSKPLTYGYSRHFRFNLSFSSSSSSLSLSLSSLVDLFSTAKITLNTYRKSFLPLSAWPEENARAPKARDLMYFTRPYLCLVHSALSAGWLTVIHTFYHHAGDEPLAFLSSCCLAERFATALADDHSHSGY